VVLNNGREVPTLPGIQDTAGASSVQLALALHHAVAAATAGQTIVMPLALPHRVDRWLYDVVGGDGGVTVGRIATFHVKPRRENRQGDELTMESFAPTLQYLPVRIMIRQDDQTSGPT
jgi:hypothetical protein